ncbi:MAG: beta-ketoacyl synthase N-terminal-like domain-containing protein, partial [Duganella sp.]
MLWISGGTRGIGMLCARHFVARHGVRKLVLTGREAMPPPSQWDACLADVRPANAALARKVAAVRALAEQGVRVEVLALADAGPEQVAQAVRRVTSDMGPIGGILHCAGVNDFDNPAFVRKTGAGFAAVLAPKVAGLDALLAAVHGQPLKFCALFSSVAAAVPSLAAGQSDYACANAYMDYVAEARASDLPVVSIEWPSWRETGMGEATTRSYRDTGLLTLADAEGLQLLDAVLAGGAGPVILPAVVDPAAWAPQRLLQRSLAQAVPAPLTGAAAAAAAAAASPAPLTGDLAAATLDWLAGLFAKELMVAAGTLDKATPFQDYGVDSIMLTQILRRVESALAAHGSTGPMDPSIFYEHPTLGAFAAYLGASHPAALAGVLGTHAAGAAVPAAAPAPVLPPPPARSPSPAASRGAVAERGDIAVVGMSCRLPGADDIDAFWRLLAEGRSAIADVPAQRWTGVTTRHAGLMTNVTDFDPAYFLLTDNDARAMDPQALLLLEETLAVLHHAGYTARDVKGSATGVYLGARSRHQPAAEALALARNPIVAVGQNYLSANISHYFDLQGPSLVLDTACSSSLVAMQMALRALQSGDIGAALVGGISLLADDGAHQLFASRKLLAEGGAFHVFDRRAGGVVPGEGVGMVMLKTLQQAIDDGDRIHAVVKALAINNDGRTAGPATPNLAAQKAVMQAALDGSGVRAQDVGYIHVNGSGSEVTDLLEVKATEAVYGAREGAPCELGSMEPNIGHPLCAKGIAGFIAVVLMLGHRQRVPFISGQEPMAHYDLAGSPFEFGRALRPWSGQAPYGALSCFADGGTNAHAILAPWDAPAGHVARRAPLALPALQRRRIHGPPAAAAWPMAEHPGRLCLTAQHPILRGHRAYGQQLLPGLAYIDILYQHFEALGVPLAELELRNLSI